MNSKDQIKESSKKQNKQKENSYLDLGETEMDGGNNKGERKCEALRERRAISQQGNGYPELCMS